MAHGGAAVRRHDLRRPGDKATGQAARDGTARVRQHDTVRKLGDGGERVAMGLRDLVYRLYERRLEASLSGHSIPRHVGVILDGNRRWARSVGLADVSSGHQKGADHIFELLGWCRQVGVEVATLWLLSTDNLARPAAEVEALLRIIEGVAEDLSGEGRPWQLRMVGALDVLPAQTAEVLKAAEERTVGRTGGAHVNIAVGYGGRREIADAVRSLLQERARAGTTIEELAEVLDVDHIA